MNKIDDLPSPLLVRVKEALSSQWREIAIHCDVDPRDITKAIPATSIPIDDGKKRGEFLFNFLVKIRYPLFLLCQALKKSSNYRLANDIEPLATRPQPGHYDGLPKFSNIALTNLYKISRLIFPYWYRIAFQCVIIRDLERETKLMDTGPVADPSFHFILYLVDIDLSMWQFICALHQVVPEEIYWEVMKYMVPEPCRSVKWYLVRGAEEYKKGGKIYFSQIGDLQRLAIPLSSSWEELLREITRESRHGTLSRLTVTKFINDLDDESDRYDDIKCATKYLELLEHLNVDWVTLRKSLQAIGRSDIIEQNPQWW